MRALTLVIATALILLGGIGYGISGGNSWTALIPSFFGLMILGLAILAGKEHLRRHMMHGVILLALLGVGGSARGLPGVMQLLAGNTVDRPMAVVIQSIMCLLCAILLVAGIVSFVAARRARRVEST